MFFVFISALIFVGFASTKSKSGFSAALAIWFPIVFILVPIWLSLSYKALLIDARLVFFFMVMIFFVGEPPPKKSQSISIADFLAFFLSGVIIFSQLRQGQLGIASPPEVLRKWFFPYLLGRWFATNWKTLGISASGFAWVLVISAGLGAFEGFVKMNLVQKITGKVFPLLEQGEGYRWGLKRAMGSLGHPIFFGMAMVCCLPWSILTASLARSGKVSKMWVTLPFATLATIIVTASRGPQMAALMVLISIPFFRYKGFRIWMTLGALLMMFTGYMFREQALELLGTAAGEKSTSETRLIYIDGEEFEYSGTAHRLLLFKVYDKAIEKVGLFGYGTKFLEGMDRVGLALPEDLEMRFGSIDNGYLLLLLQHGWLSVWVFIGFATVVIYNGLYLGLRVQGPLGIFAGTMGVSLLAVMVFLTSVWFCPDFSAFWFFNAGLLVSMSQFPAQRQIRPISRFGFQKMRSSHRPEYNRETPKQPDLNLVDGQGTWLRKKAKLADSIPRSPWNGGKAKPRPMPLGTDPLNSDPWKKKGSPAKPSFIPFDKSKAPERDFDPKSDSTIGLTPGSKEKSLEKTEFTDSQKSTRPSVSDCITNLFPGGSETVLLEPGNNPLTKLESENPDTTQSKSPTAEYPIINSTELIIYFKWANEFEPFPVRTKFNRAPVSDPGMPSGNLTSENPISYSPISVDFNGNGSKTPALPVSDPQIRSAPQTGLIPFVHWPAGLAPFPLPLQPIPESKQPVSINRNLSPSGEVAEGPLAASPSAPKSAEMNSSQASVPGAISEAVKPVPPVRASETEPQDEGKTNPEAQTNQKPKTIQANVLEQVLTLETQTEAIHSERPEIFAENPDPNSKLPITPGLPKQNATPESGATDG